MTKERRSSMAEMPESTARGYGRNPESSTGGVSSVAATEEQPRPEAEHLMEAVVERKNMVAAYKRVVSNKGSAGVDEMTMEDLAAQLREHWSGIKEQLLQGTYEPQAVRGVEIPKPGKKGTRRLGIPTVVDRLIQQAMLQVLHPVFDPGFSESSYGFRPGRSAHQAVLKAREYAQASYTWPGRSLRELLGHATGVVDLDLEKFFDRVNHDMLMARVARKVKDKRVLKTIRRFLQAGMMEQGLVRPRREGTPQGGPLSPLLSNIVLDDLDKELERRGHRFCRYADDCNVYVQSRRAGERVLESVTTFLTRRLKLKVNEEKSAVDQLWNRSRANSGRYSEWPGGGAWRGRSSI